MSRPSVFVRCELRAGDERPIYWSIDLWLHCYILMLLRKKIFFR